MWYVNSYVRSFPRLTVLVASLIAANSALAANDGVDDLRANVVVIGGSSGGIAAALGAARMGVKVILLEDTPVLGGMLSNGVTGDSFSTAALSGIYDEFRQRVKAYYAPIARTDPALLRPPLNPTQNPEFFAADGRSHQSHPSGDGGVWEAHVADRIFKEMAREQPNLTIIYNSHATSAITQTVHGRRIVGVHYESNSGAQKGVLRAKIFIDASHEGDVAAWAGVPYRVGREPKSNLEPHAGQIHFLDETGEFLPGSTGQGDRAIVSYGLRLLIKVNDKNAVPQLIPEPPGYDRRDYEAAGCTKKPYVYLPNNMFELNDNPIGNELQEVNWSWPEANFKERRRLYKIYREHAIGYLYFQQHDCGMTSFSLPDGEFVDNGHVPYRLYVREARRIEGQITVTEADINPFLFGHEFTPPLRSDSIAIGHYPIDMKPVRRKENLALPDKSDGDAFLFNAVSAFQIPYGAIVPRKVKGLLVPVAMSATHVAFSAIRMDPTWMAMGQAAGVAAAESIKLNIDPDKLNVQTLQRTLLQQGLKLSFYWDLPENHPAFRAVQWLSVQLIVKGDGQRDFHPDATLTRADLASWTVTLLTLSPSVSNIHFSDVSPDNPAFRPIETLFDTGLLRYFDIKPLWPTLGGFTPTRNIGLLQRRGSFGDFKPNKAVSWRELAGLSCDPRLRASDDVFCGKQEPNDMALISYIHTLLSNAEFGMRDQPHPISLDAPVTRGEAAMIFASLLDYQPSLTEPAAQIRRRS